VFDNNLALGVMVLGQLAKKQHHVVEKQGESFALGGDLLFLLRSLTLCTGGVVQQSSQKILKRVGAPYVWMCI